MGWIFRRRKSEEPTKPEYTFQMIGTMADGVLHVLRDGRPHDVVEISEELSIPPDRVDDILDFLSMLGLVQKYAQITKMGRKFMKLPQG